MRTSNTSFKAEELFFTDWTSHAYIHIYILDVLHAEILMISLTFQTQIQYLKQVQQPSAAQLRSSMVDPAINLFFLKMKAELEQTKDKLEQAQNELSAWKFTPDR